MTESTIERVERAVKAANVGEYTSDAQALGIAIAAVRALREPDLAHLDIGVHATGIPWGFGIADAELLWRAVIDSILDDTEKRG